jgi:hypothetical protein
LFDKVITRGNWGDAKSPNKNGLEDIDFKMPKRESFSDFLREKGESINT